MSPIENSFFFFWMKKKKKKICSFKLNMYKFFLSNHTHYLPLFNYFIFFNLIIISAIKLAQTLYIQSKHTEPSGLLFWKVNL